MRAQPTQSAWRTALERLPSLGGHFVLDLGCGDGEAAADMVGRGARVLGLDRDAERLERARARGLAGAEFRTADLSGALHGVAQADGIWCAYAAAYFPRFEPVLRTWGAALRPGGWMLLLEVDDLLDHRPLDARWRALLADFASEARSSGRYDFHLGHRLVDEVRGAGLELEWELALADPELACDGPLGEAALAGWRARLERMSLLRAAAGDDAPALTADLLACLAHPEHTTSARVHAVLARRPR